MKRWIGPLVAMVVCGIAAHFAVLHFTPGLIMDRTLSALKDRGIAEHAFTTPLRITPQTQAVVRTSPDLFYSLCRYDLSEEGSELSITMAEWPGYQSLSFFDADTNNFATIRGTGEAKNAYLITKRHPVGEDSHKILSPTSRGVVLIRRLAPTQELFDAAKEASVNDSCEWKAG